MGDRKENLKKALCLSEYPWSSDDEEATPPQAEPISLVQEVMPDETRPSTGDRPGTSSMSAGTSSSQMAAVTRRSQTRADRDLFWSYLANSSRLSSISRSRSEANRDQWARQSDLRHILAFKKVNRSGVPTSRSATSLFAIQRAAQANANRLSGLGQYSSPSGSPLASDIAAAVYHGSSSRFGANRLEDLAQQPSQSSSGFRFPRLRDFHVDRSNAQNEEMAREPASAEQSDDDVEMTGVSAPPHELLVHHDEQNEDEVPNAPEISLEEEIVEIEGGGGGEEGAGGEGAGGESPHPTAHTHNDTVDALAEDVQEITLPNASTENASRQGVKRKRNSVENEPATVKEFNQRMLRVLECPVCLECMEPPLSQCRRGHLICARCRARIAACPVCRCAFSSVRNRAMETVAEMLRYPCRHGCGREVRLRRRGAHEASCPARRYHCVAPACAAGPALMPRDQLAKHVQNHHMSMMKVGPKHRLMIKVQGEVRDNWLVLALRELFHLRVDVDVHWGVNVHVAYIGPKRHASTFLYEVTVMGQHDSRRMIYTRATHCDLDCPSSRVFRHDCFALSLDQAMHYLRTGHDSDKCLHLDIEIRHSEATERTDSDS